MKMPWYLKYKGIEGNNWIFEINKIWFLYQRIKLKLNENKRIKK